MKRFVYVSAAALFLASCGGSKQEDPKPKDTPPVVMAVTGNPADNIISLYIQLKDALVKDSLPMVNEAAKNVSENTKPDSAQLKAIDPAKQPGYTSLCSEIHARVGMLADAKDLQMKRTIFKEMTPSLKKLSEQYGSGKTPVYEQYCPMAFNNTGATWLSLETKIRNPYLPKTMLKCGMVQDTLKQKP